MELDELKADWNKLQQQQKELSTDTINQIIMNTSTTMQEMQQKNQYWNKLGKVVFPVLIVVLIVNVIIRYFAPLPDTTFPANIIYALIMIVFAVVSLYMYRWQEKILACYNPGDLKASLTKTIKDFKQFYLVYNLAYGVLFPTYFYAMFKFLLNVVFHLSENTILTSCAVLTILSIIAAHIHYRRTYFKRIRSLEADLRELDN
jgi:hypothetical protein